MEEVEEDNFFEQNWNKGFKEYNTQLPKYFSK